MKDEALRLPPALAVWGELFADMPEPNLRLLAALVTLLSPLVDKAEAAGARPRGEIDSFSGIGTRGGIDRLLASEWLWRDLAPDEFVRRLAEREALTFEPVHRQAADARTVLVVLDAGPAMLGRPRLVGFAALLCLAASAKGRGARLLWSSNAMPEPAWREALKRADIVQLLDQVSPTALGEADVGQLLAAPALAEGRRKVAPSLWLIGAGDLPEAATAAGRIAIAERPRLDATGFTVAAQVDVTAASGRTASARFDLPDEAEATALLREPFRRPLGTAKASRKPRVARPDWAQAAMTFTRDAAYLIIAMRDGVLVVPTDAGRQTWRVAIARYERLVALDVTSYRLSLATATPAGIVLREASLRADAPALRPIFANEMPPDHPLIEPRWPRATLPVLGRPGDRPSFWTLASDGAPFSVAAEGAKPFAPLSSGPILKVCDQAILTRKYSGKIVASERATGRTLARFPLPHGFTEGAAVLDLLVSRDFSRRLVVKRADGSWHIARNGAADTVTRAPASSRERIVGFVVDPDAPDTPSAISTDPDGNLYLRNDTLASLGHRARQSDPMPDLILAAPGDARGPWLAMACLDGEGYVESVVLESFRGVRAPFRAVAAIASEASCLSG